MDEDLTCPFCGGKVRIGVTDRDGNYPKPDDFEREVRKEWPEYPFGYILIHDETDIPEGKDCPIASHSEDERGQGRCIYDSRQEARDAWLPQDSLQVKLDKWEKALRDEIYRLWYEWDNGETPVSEGYTRDRIQFINETLKYYLKKDPIIVKLRGDEVPFTGVYNG